MKQQEDRFTRDTFATPVRGRPRKPDALTPAQRAKLYRQRKKAAAAISVTRHEKS
ncbi:hypothetical protein ACO0LO_24415 [Undibacterium sp. TJN25]|uniref:hypothetical protein n=1 Tax=Undibacterium sp. TJN25 TaxID=3413056 RepID=UPI003BF40701